MATLCGSQGLVVTSVPALPAAQLGDAGLLPLPPCAGAVLCEDMPLRVTKVVLRASLPRAILCGPAPQCLCLAQLSLLITASSPPMSHPHSLHVWSSCVQCFIGPQTGSWSALRFCPSSSHRLECLFPFWLLGSMTFFNVVGKHYHLYGALPDTFQPPCRCSYSTRVPGPSTPLPKCYMHTEASFIALVKLPWDLCAGLWLF